MMFIRQTLSSLMIASLCVGLVACGDDNDDNGGSNNPPATQTETIKGVAATGNPFVGKIKVVNASGVESSEVTIAADGTYTVTVPKGAPYMIKAYNDQQTLYSYAPKIIANIPVNITQLTTAALFDAHDQLNLASLYEGWEKTADRPTEAEVIQSAKEVIANLKTTMIANGLTATEVNGLNVFNYKFTPTADNKFDNLLDDVQMSYTCNVTSCNVSYTVNDKTFAWNYSIGVDGITINFDGSGVVIPDGNYNLKVTTTVAGIATAVNIANVPKPESQADFCAAQDVVNQLPQGFTINSCSYNGSTGTINATVSANGFSISYSIKYEYTAA